MDRLKDVRVRLGVGQIHMARQLGLPQQYVSVLERIDLGVEWTERYLLALLEVCDREGADCWAGSGKGERGCGCGAKKGSGDELPAVREPTDE